MWEISQGQPAFSVSANSTSAQIFPLRVDAGGGSYSASATLPAQLAVPGSGRLDGRPFIVRVSGVVKVLTTATVVLSLYASKSSGTIPSSGNASLTASSNIPIHISSASSSITGGATAIKPFSAEYHFEGDTASGLVQGYADVIINGVKQAQVAFSEASGVPLTGVVFGPAAASSTPPPATEPAFNLVVGVTFSANAASPNTNSAVLETFSLDA